MVLDILSFPGGSVIKNPPAMQEMRVPYLGLEGSLEEEMATLSYSCLENCMDREAWQATDHVIAKELNTT